ncbi:btrR [Symbiodinium microadriaticum]|nr:btrR [Symbiodinium microadriaticum]
MDERLKLSQTAILDAVDGDVCIFGAGAIGLCHLLLLKHEGKSLSGLEPAALSLARAAPQGSRQDWAKVAASWSSIVLAQSSSPVALDELSGLPAGLVTGRSVAFQSQFGPKPQEVASSAALVVLVGIPEVDHLPYNPHVARTKELTILNVRRANQTLATCLELLSTSAQLREGCLTMLTHQMSIQSAFEMASSYQDGAIKIALFPEVKRHSLKRVGLIGGTAHSVEYFRQLQATHGIELVLVAVDEIDSVKWPHVDENRKKLSDLCSEQKVRHLDSLTETPTGVEELGLDLLIDAGWHLQVDAPRAILSEALAPHGVRVTTALALPCASMACALLGGGPVGITSFINEDTLVDICEVQTESACSGWEAIETLSAAAARRLPGWIQALQTGDYDMSMLGVWRSSRRCWKKPGAAAPGVHPNEGWVSWHWRSSFLQRFARSQQLEPHAQATRLCREDGQEVRFTVLQVHPVDKFLTARERLQRFASALPGEVLCVDGNCAWVRGADAEIQCQLSEPLRKGEVLRSIGDRGARGIPVDFSGELWLPSLPTITDGVSVSSTPPERHAEGGVERRSTPRNVPMFRLDFESDFVDAFAAGARDILCSGRPLSENVFTRKFEAAFSKLVHAPFALATTSGTVALDIAMRAVGVAGKVAVIPSNTFFATQVAASNAGAVLEWVEIEPEYMQVCPRSLEAVFRRHAPGSIAAVVLVHIAGIISPHFRRIRELCAANGAALVEDAAHAHTAVSDTEHAGTIGDVAAFSFFPTKVMTAGEAGMVTTKNEALFKRMQSIKEFGKDKNPTEEAQAKFIELSEAYSALSGSASRGKSVPRSKEKTKKPFGHNVHLAEALKIFAASVGLSNELGEIEWAAVETKVSEMLSQAAESVEQALRQRYLHANGAIRWQQVLGILACSQSQHVATECHRFPWYRCHF